VIVRLVSSRQMADECTLHQGICGHAAGRASLAVGPNGGRDEQFVVGAEPAQAGGARPLLPGVACRM
jgi:hypothetical protein